MSVPGQPCYPGPQYFPDGEQEALRDMLASRVVCSYTRFYPHSRSYRKTLCYYSVALNATNALHALPPIVILEPGALPATAVRFAWITRARLWIMTRGSNIGTTPTKSCTVRCLYYLMTESFTTHSAYRWRVLRYYGVSL
jgi:hypothetical protein